MSFGGIGVGEDEGKSARFCIAVGDAEAAAGAKFLIEDGFALQHANGLDVAWAAEGAGVTENALGVEA